LQIASRCFSLIAATGAPLRLRHARPAAQLSVRSVRRTALERESWDSLSAMDRRVRRRRRRADKRRRDTSPDASSEIPAADASSTAADSHIARIAGPTEQSHSLPDEPKWGDGPVARKLFWTFIILLGVHQLTLLTRRYWERFEVAPYVVLEASVAALVRIAWRPGRVRSYRGRVACLAALFMACVLQFAVVYAVLARNVPAAFRVSDNLLDERLLRQFDDDRRTIAENASLLAAAAVMQANAAAVLAALPR
jgi:hypothetical protein